MNRLGILIPALCTVAFGLTDLTAIPDTAIIGDTIRIAAVYSEPGQTATVFTFLDLNGNGIYDETLDLLEFGPDDNAELTDGEWSIDTVVDGLLNGELYTSEEPWRIVGTHVSYLADDGGPDTGTIVVRMDSSGLYVSGTVQGPDPLANAFVFLEVRNASGQPIYEVEVVTDAQGRYLIYLPENTAGADGIISIDALDRLGKASQGYIPPGSLEIDPSDMSGPITGRNLMFIRAPYTLLCTVVDENSDPVSGLDLQLSGDNGLDIFVQSDDNGEFQAGLPQGTLRIGPTGEEATEYLFESKEIEIDGSSDTIRVTYRAHSTDTTISGTIIDTFNLGLDYNGVELEVEVAGNPQWNGGAGVDRGGTFSIRVSSRLGPYLVCIDPHDALPENYEFSIYCVDSIAPGTDTMKIYVVRKGAALRRIARTSPAAPVTLASISRDLSVVHLDTYHAGEARIRCFRADGRIAATLYEGRIAAGANRLAPHCPAIAAGLYILNVEVVAQGRRYSIVKNVMKEK